jgi:hypothetical protein
MIKELTNCKMCGTKPDGPYQITLVSKGCDLKAWCVECEKNAQPETLPFFEHSVEVYGETKEEAIARWNEVNS